jgi:PTS system N-acetylglucosamine-specific IIC component
LPERRRLVGGLLGSIALTSLLTGVTEPIEFTFMFLAPLLYAVHALLTGIAFILMNALHVRLGFGFSAGLFDYVLNFNRATRPLWLIPVGLGYFALYYLLFRWVIVRFDLKTPGRAAVEAAPAPARATGSQAAGEWIEALGGAANLTAVAACTTRLRLTVASQAGVDGTALSRLGARGLVRPSPQALQVVIGPTADRLAGEIRAALAGALPAVAVRNAHKPAVSETPLPAAPASSGWSGRGEPLLAALGGSANVHAVEAFSTRLRVRVADPGRVDASALAVLGTRGLALPAPGIVHIIVGPEAAAAATTLRHLLT